MTSFILKTVATLALACSALLATADTQPATASGRFDFDTTPGNLPKSVVPLRHALRLDVDPARDDFTGEAQIDIEVREPVGAIVLHARDLEAGRLELRQGRQRAHARPHAGPLRAELVAGAARCPGDRAGPLPPGPDLARGA